MDWIKKIIGDDPEPQFERREVYEGAFEDADGKLQEGLTTLMNFAMNGQGGGGVREVGEKMNLEMHGIQVGVTDSDGKVVGVKDVGNYRITVERIA